ncbi:MAG: hypothetical protein PHV34_16485 [Verrucomicrobiae bacterium]|nr:hypothetical protein [Verrucomicrobiae bacterium]
MDDEESDQIGIIAFDAMMKPASGKNEPFPVFEISPDVPPITSEQVHDLLDGEGPGR